MTRPAEDIGSLVRTVLERAAGEVTQVADLTLSPDGRSLAFTGSRVLDPAAGPRRCLGVVEIATGAVRWHAEPAVETHGPSWASTGDLAYLAERAAATRVEFAELSGDGDLAVRGEGTTLSRLHPEYVRCAPNGARVLVGVAETGAELSDVHGSGTLAAAADTPPWQPVVDHGGAAPGGWRRLWLIDADADGGGARCVSPDGMNIWEAAWAGNAHVVLTWSDGPSESDWYRARLGVLDLSAGTVDTLLAPEFQVVAPAASPSGRQVSAITGIMSDRGLDTGDLVVVDPGGDPGRAGGATTRILDTFGVDVTDQHWADEDTLVVVGQRGLHTVVARIDVPSGAVAEIWASEDTCGSTLVPAVAVGGTHVYACTHGYERAPALTRLSSGGEQVVATLNSDPAALRFGSVELLDWVGADGDTVQGVLVVPDRPGPHPLVVNIHGGPVGAWRSSAALLHPYTPLLVARGYAVLHPNIRGSSGRGQVFALDGVRDMGGRDAVDVLTAVAALIEAGRADPARVGVTGNSYGGFMAAWLAATSTVFAAAMPRSPVTDWVSQHFASNLPGFDRLCLTGDPLAPTTDYRSRSPLYLAGDVRTPVLLTAGANDLATPPEQAAMFHRAIVERGGTSTLVIYPLEGHGVRGHDALVDQCTRMVEFFDQHLGVDG